jgi:hypothetical protein
MYPRIPKEPQIWAFVMLVFLFAVPIKPVSGAIGPRIAYQSVLAPASPPVRIRAEVIDDWAKIP